MADQTGSATAAGGGENRRASPRRPASAIPNLQARLVAGPDVRLIDVSRRGVLIETPSRLLPGSAVRVKFVVEDKTLVLRGGVVRSNVRNVTDTGLLYRTAVAFDQDISLCDPSLWQEPVQPSPVLSVVPAHSRTRTRPRCPRARRRRRSSPCLRPTGTTSGRCSRSTTGRGGGSSPRVHATALLHRAPFRRRRGPAGAGETDAARPRRGVRHCARCAAAPPRRPGRCGRAGGHGPPVARPAEDDRGDPRGITGDIAHRAGPSGADLLAADAVLAGADDTLVKHKEFVLQAPALFIQIARRRDRNPRIAARLRVLFAGGPAADPPDSDEHLDVMPVDQGWWTAPGERTAAIRPDVIVLDEHNGATAMPRPSVRCTRAESRRPWRWSPRARRRSPPPPTSGWESRRPWPLRTARACVNCCGRW